MNSDSLMPSGGRPQEFAIPYPGLNQPKRRITIQGWTVQDSRVRLMPPKDKDRLRAELRLPQRPVRSTRRQRLLQNLLTSTWARLAAAVGFAAGIVGIGDWSWAVYQNTLPDITARDSDTDSTFLLPIIVQNRSTVLDMKNVELKCGIGTFFLGNGKQTMMMVAGLVSSQSHAVIPAGHPINFSCDASSLVKFEGAKGISILGMHSDLPVEPMKITGINTTVEIRYVTLGWGRIYRSDPFNWTCTPERCHWTKGPTIQ